MKFNNEAGQEAAEFFLSLKDYMPENMMSLAAEDAFSTIFGQGKAAFGVTRSSAIPETLQGILSESELELCDILKEQRLRYIRRNRLSDFIFPAKNPKLCMKLIKYITGSEFMTEYHKIASGAPLTKSEPYQGDAKMERIVTEDRDKYRPLQVGPCGSDILQNLASELQGMMEREQNSEGSTDDAAAYGDQALDEYWADKE